MGNKRKIKSLKGSMLKKHNKSSFSTVANIQVIDESVTDARPSNKSDTELLQNNIDKEGSDVEQTVKIGRTRTDEVVSKKVRKRKMPPPDEPPVKKIHSKPMSHKHNKLNEEAENETDDAESEVVDEDDSNIRDEDIDKFCDELDDADNEQFEMWVKLVEEKLREKKK